MKEEKPDVVCNSRTIIFREHPYFYVTLTDLEPGKGLIQIFSDWGNYAAYWGSMGVDRKIDQFLARCDSYYIENNLSVGMSYLGVKKEAFGRLSKFMSHCWPRFARILEEETKKEKTA